MRAPSHLNPMTLTTDVSTFDTSRSYRDPCRYPARRTALNRARHEDSTWICVHNLTSYSPIQAAMASELKLFASQTRIQLWSQCPWPRKRLSVEDTFRPTSVPLLSTRARPGLPRSPDRPRCFGWLRGFHCSFHGEIRVDASIDVGFSKASTAISA